jgi:SAM-dependent methyltransferase
MSARLCRFCASPLEVSFCDLGMSPLSNSYVKVEDAGHRESFYPLHAFVCDRCFLVQLEEFETPEQIFGDYAYFSSFSDSWLDHAKRYAGHMTQLLGLGPQSLVVEIASNDGYLLQYFKAAGIPVLGIEPARNVAQEAVKKGVPTVTEFFGVATAERLAREGRRADLLLGNNVFAHVPDLNDFAAGFAKILKPEGVLTLEFPHLLNLMRENQFDTIYHEHFSYFSFATAQRVLERHGLKVFDVETLPTHGGSLRVYAAPARSSRAIAPRVAELLATEQAAGLDKLDSYRAFAEQVKETKRGILSFLIGAKAQGKSVVGYGAPAKGNTLLNYCGIRTDFLDYTVDRSPHKQGTLLPGTRIPVHAPERIFETKPDYVLILPWNLKDEITAQMAGIRAWGGQFVVPVPRISII